MNDLGVTKAEARAALRELKTGLPQIGVATAVYSMWDERSGIEWKFPDDPDWLYTALALVATIGGAVDGRGRPK